MSLSFQDILDASHPEDIFGYNSATTKKEVKDKYREIVAWVHPDHNDNSEISNNAFVALQYLYDDASRKITTGVYGTVSLLTIDSAFTYEVISHAYDTLFADVYNCRIGAGDYGLFAIAKSPKLNPYLVQEQKNIKLLYQEPAYKFQLPNLIESFTYSEEGVHRQVNVFGANTNFVTLQDVVNANLNGLNAKDMAWIYRRLLDILGYAHQGVKTMHGSITPKDILIGLGDTHDVRLINWYSDHSSSGSKQRFIDPYPDYKVLYPPEVLQKEEYTPSSDIYMATKCMEMLLGGDVPAPMKAFFQACTGIKNPKHRLQDAWQLRKEFTLLIEKMWGKREYRPLTLTESRK